jgi:GTP-binding protein
LKLIATAGLVGLPNAGKSTLISKISAARPKIADYPFTTLTPNLGVVDFHGRSMIVADIPGILEGAHQGEGMGLEFLRHIERTRVLLFVIDASPYAALPPLKTFEVLENELKQYHPQLLQKKLLVLANKIDLAEQDKSGIDALRNFCRRRKIPFMEISALQATNLEKMKKTLFSLHDPA